MRTVEVRSVGISLVLVILALVCFALAAAGVPSLFNRISWMALGLFLWCLATVVP